MAETWVSRPELEDLIGRNAAEVLCRCHGGVPVYVPVKVDADSALGRIIGIGPLRVLSSLYGGESITVPNGRRTEPFKGRILALLEEGHSCAAIALELGVTDRHVRELASRARPRARQLSLL